MYIVRIDHDALPEEEREAAFQIEQNLHGLRSLAAEFGHAFDLYIDAHERKLALYEGSGEQWKFIAWMTIAGRAGAINAHGFSMLLEEINSTKAPTIWAKADMGAKEAATKLFAVEFPAVAGIRISAAHPGELQKNRREATKHRLGGIGLFMESCVTAEPDHMLFGATFKRKFVGYELSERKAETLFKIIRLYQETFYPLEGDWAAETRARVLESDAQYRAAQSGRLRSWDTPGFPER